MLEISLFKLVNVMPPEWLPLPPDALAPVIGVDGPVVDHHLLAALGKGGHVEAGQDPVVYRAEAADIEAEPASKRVIWTHTC